MDSPTLYSRFMDLLADRNPVISSPKDPGSTPNRFRTNTNALVIMSPYPQVEKNTEYIYDRDDHHSQTRRLLQGMDGLDDCRPPHFVLHPGALFYGVQTSSRRQYSVSVSLFHLDLDNSFLCGSIQISGISRGLYSLATFFEAEIIGPHHSFLTNKWNTDLGIDLFYWSLFKEFSPHKDCFIQNPGFGPPPGHFMFMRWKEKFILSGAEIASSKAASYDGFYYVCANLVSGAILGFYYNVDNNPNVHSETLKLVYDFNSLESRSSGAYRFH